MLRGLSNLHTDGDIKELATRINVFFHQVSAGLNPPDDTAKSLLSDICPSEFTINLAEVERKMSEIDIHKAPGPDGLPNWILHNLPGLYVLSSMPPFVKDLFHHDGRKPT